MNQNIKGFFGFFSLILIGLLMLIYIPKKEPAPYKQTRLLMDTYISISVIAPKEKAERPVNLAFRRMKQIENKLNHYDAKSEVSKINQLAPKPVVVSELTFKAIKMGLRYSALSGGKFDITVGPLIKLFDFNKKIVPSYQQVRKAKRLVGYKMVLLDKKRQTVTLAKKGMILDLGGLEKGLAADEAYKTLKKNGVEEGLIDTGSSVLAFNNQKRNGRVWKIGIRHPREDSIITTLNVTNRNISTSGDYQQYFIKNGRRYHHIIDPLTGYPSRGLINVTVISKKSGVESDILSTAIFAMGPQEGLEFAKSLKDTETVLIDTQGNVEIANKKIAKLAKTIKFK